MNSMQWSDDERIACKGELIRVTTNALAVQCSRATSPAPLATKSIIGYMHGQALGALLASQMHENLACGGI